MSATARGSSGTTTAQTRGEPAKALAVRAPLAAGAVAEPFAGAYVAAFGGLSRSLNKTSEPNAATATLGLFPSNLSPTEAGLALGYNAVSGRLMFGLETAARLDFASNESNTVVGSHVLHSLLLQPSNSQSLGPISLPQSRGCFRGIPCFGVLSNAPITLADLTADRHTITERGSGELIGRIGAVYGNWLIYSRLGAGATLFTQQRVTTTSNLQCDHPNYSYSGLDPFSGLYRGVSLLSCGSTRTTTTASSASTKSAWLPHFVLGLGLEANFGRYFARAEANATEYIGTSNGLGIDNAFARYDGRIGVGLRF